MNVPTGRIPVTVLTGFLGSGKTTLLHALLLHPQLEDTAVVVNELGEIGLDHVLVTGAIDNVVLLDAGCLCCTVLDTLRETLIDLYGRRSTGDVPHFRRVLVETSGLADPTPVLQSLLRDSLITPYYAFDGLVTTVDALFAETALDEYSESVQQIALADRRNLLIPVESALLSPLPADILLVRGQLGPDICQSEQPDTRFRCCHRHACNGSVSLVF